MADYHTHFSCTLDLADETQLEKAKAFFEDCATKLLEDDCGAIGFALETRPGTPPHLWIWSEDFGEPDHVTAFVAELGPLLGLSGLWGFEWSHICSKPRTDAFGGGAVVIDLATGAIVDTLSTNDWLTRRIEDPSNVER